jgi:methylenetetrahydrofolate reductase (NADPH)
VTLLHFLRRRTETEPAEVPGLNDFVSGYSIEILPRTAARVASFRALLPQGTRVYIAHIEGTPIAEMVATARRLRGEGFPVMPHFPARLIADKVTLEDWIRQYSRVGVNEALVLAGGRSQPVGTFESSIDLLKTGLFQEYGFRRLHVAGHPEGNRDIDPDGSTARADEALAWKQAFAKRLGIEMAIVTQFARPLTAWVERLRAGGITLPVHMGVAGPARLQTLIKYALACGVGPSLRILHRRAMDVSRLMLPYEPTEVVAGVAAYRAAHPQCGIEQVHIFPLGGIKAAVEWADAHGEPARKAGAA